MAGRKACVAARPRPSNRSRHLLGLKPLLSDCASGCIAAIQGRVYHDLSMESHCISFREIPDIAKLFSSFLENFPSVASYYAHSPTAQGVDAAAREVRLDPATRRSPVEVLREQNRRLGADDSTERSLGRLAAGAVAIVTGQQVGLFSGPAFSFYKAISAIRYAQETTARGMDAVPVFWLATEDHDLDEVSHVFWNTRNGLARYELPIQQGEAGKRAGEVILGEAVQPLLARACESLEGPFADEITGGLQKSYSAGETLGSAFGKLMARLLVGRGIIFIDPLDARLHRLALPIYRQALEETEPLRDELLARATELDSNGFHAQVKVTRETTLLFCNVDGYRKPLRTRNGKFTAGKASYSREELLAWMERAPEDFTPNVLLRPVVQDTLLPTAAYVAGPAEIAYMAQASVPYQRMLGRMPAILPRASFTIVEPHIAGLLAKYNLGMRDFFRGRQYLRGKMELESLPASLARQFETDESVLGRVLAAYEDPLKRLDPTLVGMLRSVERKMAYQFAKLKGKAARAENFRTGVLDRHERILLDTLYPNRSLQERSLCVLPFLAGYGPALLDKLAQPIVPGSVEGTPCVQQHIVLVL
jgi:bacillithiol synthase